MSRRGTLYRDFKVVTRSRKAMKSIKYYHGSQEKEYFKEEKMDSNIKYESVKMRSKASTPALVIQILSGP